MRRLAVAAALAMTACGGATTKHNVIATATAATFTATVACGVAGTRYARTNTQKFGWQACIVLGGVTTAGGLVLLDAEAREQGVIDHD